MRLNFPPSHSRADIEALFDRFAFAQPEIYAAALRLRASQIGKRIDSDAPPPPLWSQYHRAARAYLKENTDWSSADALTFGVNDFHKILNERAKHIKNRRLY